MHVTEDMLSHSYCCVAKKYEQKKNNSHQTYSYPYQPISFVAAKLYLKICLLSQYNKG